MRIGIQRRQVYLLPPDEADLEWLRLALNEEEVWRSFGYDRPAGDLLLQRRGELIVAMVRKARSPGAGRPARLSRTVAQLATSEGRFLHAPPVGFIVVFPPTSSFPVHELAYAIPRRTDRDAFTALAAADAMSYYLFEHLGLTEVGWRTRSTNLAAQAILRRLGYGAAGEARIEGTKYLIHRLHRSRWLARKGRLERYEAVHPSGTGGTFVTLSGPPWRPPMPLLGK